MDSDAAGPEGRDKRRIAGPGRPRQAWKSAPANEWSKPVRARRARAIAVARCLAPLAGQRLVFPHLLTRALGQAERERGFRLPPYYALNYYGDRLLVEIDPAWMTRVMKAWLTDGRRQLHTLDAFLSGARWRGLALPLGSTEVTRQMQELFANGMDHTRTATYAKMLASLREGKPASRRRQILDSEAAIERYFADVRALVDSIRAHGLLSHRAGSAAFDVDRDIGVALDADGDIVKLPGGQHRVAIAAVLGIPRIPVEVRMVHTELLRSVTAREGLDPVEGVLAACSDAAAGPS